MIQANLEHPWVLDIPINGSPTTPNSAAWMDAGLAALADTPLTHNERLSAILLVTGHARWAGMVFAGYARIVREGGLSEHDVAQREDATFRQLISADAYPALRAAIDEGVFLDEADPFAFNLARSLDGLETYIAAAADGIRDRPQPWQKADDADIADDKRFREARRSVREAERMLRDARKAERQAAREARERRLRATT
jgi:hypothetical protein